MLFSKNTTTREAISLNGVWRFVLDGDNDGVAKQLFTAPLKESIPMPVPASYNDITQDARIRDHVGIAWYEREFIVPRSWKGLETVLRFGAVTHDAVVYLDGVEVGSHRGGFLPFDVNLTAYVTFGKTHRLTVQVDNRLYAHSLPTGTVEAAVEGSASAGALRQVINFDFFNYAGLHRDVTLCGLPPERIVDIAVSTDIDGADGLISYTVKTTDTSGTVEVRVVNAEGRPEAGGESASGTLRVSQAELWEPGRPYLYTLVARLLDARGDIVDEYDIRVGIRTVSVNGDGLYLNGKRVYLTGFGKHEDTPVRGRGFDQVWMVKDYNLIEWMGANSFRTSHYPYDERWLDMADEQGVLVIDECPAVGMINFADRSCDFFNGSESIHETLTTHLQVMRDLVARDKNHPSVIMWSVANEAPTWEEAARPYFEEVIATTRRLDPTRPITIANFAQPNECRVADMVDVIGINRYPSWYSDPGRLEVIVPSLTEEFQTWHRRFGKPILVTEYGTDTIPGFHADPPEMFSEEYQCEFYRRCHEVFDRLDYVVGEHVWNFADFRTKQGIIRVGGNRKGVLTRSREPKAAAHLLRERWRRLRESAA